MAGLTRILAIVVAFVLAVAPAIAHPPAELQSFVGAKAGQAEGGIINLGYVNISKNFWWNAAEGTCVKLTVSQGRYKAIDVIKPSFCGKKISSGTGPGAGCPADVSEANRYLYPDCDKPSGGGGGSSGEVPQAALNACMARADAYQNVASGTSVVNGATQSGGNWVLKMASGTYMSVCTVTAAGRVVDISPVS